MDASPFKQLLAHGQRIRDAHQALITVTQRIAAAAAEARRQGQPASQPEADQGKPVT